MVDEAGQGSLSASFHCTMVKLHEKNCIFVLKIKKNNKNKPFI